MADNQLTGRAAAPRSSALDTLPPELVVRRERACRLRSELWLQNLDEARGFLADRGMLTGFPTWHLPSLFGACEPVADPDARGFARLPADKWWWEGALADMRGVLRLKVLSGKAVLLDESLAGLVGPLCSASLTRADGGDLGPAAATLARHLSDAGPSLLEDARRELGWDAATMRRARDSVESVGAVISRQVKLDAANGGHRHSSMLMRWDQTEWHTKQGAVGDEAADLVAAAVRAAVVAPASEVDRWFTWPETRRLVGSLLSDGRLTTPAPGWVSVKTSS